MTRVDKGWTKAVHAIDNAVHWLDSLIHPADKPSSNQPEIGPIGDRTTENNPESPVIDALSVLVDRAGEAWRQWLPAAPVIGLLYAGWAGASVWWYMDLVGLFALLVLICNPFALLTQALAPGTRVCLSVSIVMILGALQLPWMELYCRVCLILISGSLIALGTIKNKDWLMSWQVQQSPQVDRVLAHLSNGGSFAAADAWERYGCRETRALLHQALHIECSESLINGPHKAVYLLAYLHGQKSAQKEIANLKKTIDRKQAVLDATDSEIEAIAEMQSEIMSLNHDLYIEKRSNQLLRESYQKLKSETADAMAQLEQIQGPQENRDAAILEYIEAGHTCAEAGTQFGLSKSGAAAAAKRARERNAKSNK